MEFILTKIHQEGSFTQCAVKSLHNDADLKDRIEFLREASTMEGCRWVVGLFSWLFFFFFRTEHVVKLIGMVTKFQPVLVLMEFMENGDLENFLRNRRQSIKMVQFTQYNFASSKTRK